MPEDGSFPANEPELIRVIMDDREPRGPMLAALAGCAAFSVEVRRLPAGDYLRTVV